MCVFLGMLLSVFKIHLKLTRNTNTKENKQEDKNEKGVVSCAHKYKCIEVLMQKKVNYYIQAQC